MTQNQSASAFWTNARGYFMVLLAYFSSSVLHMCSIVYQFSIVANIQSDNNIVDFLLGKIACGIATY